MNLKREIKPGVHHATPKREPSQRHKAPSAVDSSAYEPSHRNCAQGQTQQSAAGVAKRNSRFQPVIMKLRRPKNIGTRVEVGGGFKSPRPCSVKGKVLGHGLRRFVHKPALFEAFVELFQARLQ